MPCNGWLIFGMFIQQEHVCFLLYVFLRLEIQRACGYAQALSFNAIGAVEQAVRFQTLMPSVLCSKQLDFKLLEIQQEVIV